MKLPKITSISAYQPLDPFRQLIAKEKSEPGLSLQARITTTDKTDQEWLDETCLNAKDVPKLDHVKLVQSWHKDSREKDYGQHLTMTLHDKFDNRLDTCHVYQEMTKGGCLVTFCKKNYGGYGLSDGSTFVGYF